MILDLVPTKELIEALARRFETMAFVGQLAPSNGEPDTHINQWRYRGNRFKAMGLAYNLIAMINTQIVAETTILKPGDLE